VFDRYRAEHHTGRPDDGTRPADDPDTLGFPGSLREYRVQIVGLFSVGLRAIVQGPVGVRLLSKDLRDALTDMDASGASWAESGFLTGKLRAANRADRYGNDGGA